MTSAEATGKEVAMFDDGLREGPGNRRPASRSCQIGSSKPCAGFMLCHLILLKN